jgi:hypothetical protein
MTAEQKVKLGRVVWVDRDRMSGAPSVTREQAEQFLELASEQLIECVSSSQT